MSDMTLALEEQTAAAFPLGSWSGKAEGRRAVAGPLLLAAALIGIGLIILAALRPAAVPSPAAPLVGAPIQPAWVEIIKPVEIFDLEAAELAKSARRYSAQRQRLGEGRRDALAFGVPGDPGFSLRLLVERRKDRLGRDARDPPDPLFAAVARQAAEDGMSVAKPGRPGLLPTRFGRFEALDVSLAPVPSAIGRTSRETACTGFRLILDDPGLTVTGLACEASRPVDRQRLGCLLDRLDLASGGDDRALIDFFAASELKRDRACGGMRLGPDAGHAPWLDDRQVTPAKNARRR